MYCIDSDSRVGGESALGGVNGYGTRERSGSVVNVIVRSLFSVVGGGDRESWSVD